MGGAEPSRSGSLAVGFPPPVERRYSTGAMDPRDLRFLLDNWEWGSFRPRFGLYRVHYEDGCRRELTAGGRLYGEIVAANAAG